MRRRGIDRYSDFSPQGWHYKISGLQQIRKICDLLMMEDIRIYNRRKDTYHLSSFLSASTHQKAECRNLLIDDLVILVPQCWKLLAHAPPPLVMLDRQIWKECIAIWEMRWTCSTKTWEARFPISCSYSLLCYATREQNLTLHKENQNYKECCLLPLPRLHPPISTENMPNLRDKQSQL